MPDAILHIGFGKTGTSSIQKHLSAHAADRIPGTNIVYCAWTREGALLCGNAITAAAAREPLGYISSTPIVPPTLTGLARGIAKIHESGLTPILSQEDWARNGADFISAFESLGLSLQVVAYVRPQIEWFNAGWWQWWAWESGFSQPSEVINAWGTHFLSWAAQLAKWAESDAVEKFDVRLHCDAVVSDFLSLIDGVPITEPDRSNSGIDPLLITLYQTFPKLRATHSSEVDIALSSLLSEKRGAPWVVSPDLADRIASSTHDDNIALLQYLSPDQQETMKADARWWNASAYAERFSASHSNEVLSHSDALKLLEAIVPAYLEEKLFDRTYLS